MPPVPPSGSAPDPWGKPLKGFTVSFAKYGNYIESFYSALLANYRMLPDMSNEKEYLWQNLASQ